MPPAQLVNSAFSVGFIALLRRHSCLSRFGSSLTRVLGEHLGLSTHPAILLTEINDARVQFSHALCELDKAPGSALEARWLMRNSRHNPETRVEEFGAV